MTMRKILASGIIPAALCAVFLFVCGKEAPCQSAPAAQVVYIKGIAKVKGAGSADWLVAQTGQKVQEGDIIKTEPDSSAELAFGDGLKNIVNVFPDSQMVISKFDPGTARLEQGRVFLLIRSLKGGSTFEVRTPTAVSGARGTGWGMQHGASGDSVQGFEHTIYVAGLNDKGELLGLTDLKEGWETSLLQGAGPGKFSHLSREERDLWRIWRENALRHVKEFKERLSGGSGAAGVSGSQGAEDRLEHIERESERTEDSRIERRNERNENRGGGGGGGEGGGGGPVDRGDY